MQSEQKIWDKISSWFIQFYRNIVAWIFFAIILYLFFIATISTTILIRDAEGGHFFISDKTALSIIMIVLIPVVGKNLLDSRAVKKFLNRIKTDDVYFKKIRIRMLAVMGIVSVLWVLSTQFIPGADQLSIMNGVYALHKEDYSKFLPGTYFEQYQNQYGILLLSYIFSFFFGSSNYIAFSLFNIAALLIFYYELSELVGDFEFGRPAQLAVVLFGLIFYPLIIYTSYIYGTLLGLAFGIMAMDMELKYLTGRDRRHAVVSVVCIMLSVAIKSNYSIFMIAAAIVAVMDILRKKEIKLIALPVLMAVVSVLATSVPKAITSHITGEPLDQGATSWGWIAMGLQEGPRAPGAFNDYNIQLYRDVCNCDSELHAELAKENINERLEIFKNDPAYAVSFFTQKQAYQWGDPTFQYAWNIRGKASTMQMSDWVQFFKSPNGTQVNLYFLDPFMSVIFFGALLFCLLCKNDINLYSTVLLTTFIGGFLFHTIWEAGPRYTLPYFVLLFPYAVAGYYKLIQYIADKKRPTVKELKSTASGRDKLTQILVAGIPYLCIVIIFISFIGLFSVGIDGTLTKDNEAYTEWLAVNSRKPLIKEGSYKLCIKTKKGNQQKGIAFTESYDPEEDKIALTVSEDPETIRLVFYQGVYWIKFPEERRYIAVHSSTKVSASMYKTDDTTNQWTLSEAADGGVNIIYNNKYALTYNEEDGTVYISQLTGERNQVWYFEKQ